MSALRYWIWAERDDVLLPQVHHRPALALPFLTPLRTEDQPNRSPTARKEYSVQSFSQLRQMPVGSPVVIRGGKEQMKGGCQTLSQTVTKWTREKTFYGDIRIHSVRVRYF
jgi:hypothetical protein